MGVPACGLREGRGEGTLNLMKRFPLIQTVLAVLLAAGCVHAQEDVAEKSDVLVPDGIFGTMRRVESETLVVPDPSAIMRAEERRAQAQEAREQRVESAEQEAPVIATQPAPDAGESAPATPSAAVEPALVEEDDAPPSLGTFEEVATETVAEETPEEDVEPEPAE